MSSMRLNAGDVGGGICISNTTSLWDSGASELVIAVTENSLIKTRLDPVSE